MRCPNISKKKKKKKQRRKFHSITLARVRVRVRLLTLPAYWGPITPHNSPGDGEPSPSYTSIPIRFVTGP
jgi:hypothetical protein